MHLAGKHCIRRSCIHLALAAASQPTQPARAAGALQAADDCTAPGAWQCGGHCRWAAAEWMHCQQHLNYGKAAAAVAAVQQGDAAATAAAACLCCRVVKCRQGLLTCCRSRGVGSDVASQLSITTSSPQLHYNRYGLGVQSAGRSHTCSQCAGKCSCHDVHDSQCLQPLSAAAAVADACCRAAPTRFC